MIEDETFDLNNKYEVLIDLKCDLLKPLNHNISRIGGITKRQKSSRKRHNALLINITSTTLKFLT